MSDQNQCSVSPLYAVIDLGSNSFHMLITRLIADGVQTVDKVKRKVRLASGLDEHNQLSEAAMHRGIECLSFFAERLQDISPENIRIVATATLRIATNADVFLKRAEQVLGYKVELLSGEQEAELIYLGVAHTSDNSARRLVLDIGGASTEIVAGGHFDMDKAVSLNMGCVTYNNQFFTDGKLSQAHFLAAISAAKNQLEPFVEIYRSLGWEEVLGGSGTMQALAEILIFHDKPAIITQTFLNELKDQLINCKTINDITISGLTSERSPVIASGLSILIALFEQFHIEQLQLSSGAIREGLLYEMLPEMRNISIRQRTLTSLTQRFHIDTEHAQRVTKQAQHLYQQHAQAWSIADSNFSNLLNASCALHEIGLLLAFKQHAKHGAYILRHADLPGFDQTERQLIVALIGSYKGDIDTKAFAHLAIASQKQAFKLLLIFRLAITLCRRRRDNVLPTYDTQSHGDNFSLTLSKQWLKEHPLLVAELNEESIQLEKLGLTIIVESKK